MVSYIRPYRKNHGVEFVTGTIAAGLGAGGVLFAARNAPAATPNTHYVFIRKLVLEYTTMVVFTVPLTQRQLSLWRGSGTISGGTSIPTTAAQDNRDAAMSFMANANGGDIRVSTTGTVNVAGVSFEGRAFASMQLTGQGAAGATKVWEYNDQDSFLGPIVLAPGEVITVRTANAFDAGGTWSLGGYMEWTEELIN